MCAQSALRHLACFVARPTNPGAGSSSADEGTIWKDVLRSAADEVTRLEPAPAVETPCPGVCTLLGVISYCYSKGVVSSAAIEREIWASPEFLAAFGQHLPCALQLRNFRRHHRSAILSVIARAHREFWRRQAMRNGDTQIACLRATEIVDNACVMDSVEAD
jgi:hypothetical protein